MNIHKHSITYALATGMVVIGLSLGIYLAGMVGSAWNYLSYVIYIVFIIFALQNWRDKERGGVLSYGKTMGYSTLFTVYYSVLMALWTYVFMTYIAPGLMESEMIKQEALMEAKGMPADQVEMAMKYARMFSKPGYIVVFAFIGNLIFLTIFNLIISAFVKKDAEQNFGDPYQNS